MPEPLLEYNDAVIFFHIPRQLKDELLKAVKLQNLSITSILNGLIADYINAIKEKLRQKKKTGRGNVDLHQIELVKKCLRKAHPNGLRKVEIARAIGVDQARCLILLNLLSGVSGDKEKEGAEFVSSDFLVCEDREGKYTKYYIFKDRELGL